MKSQDNSFPGFLGIVLAFCLVYGSPTALAIYKVYGDGKGSDGMAREMIIRGHLSSHSELLGRWVCTKKDPWKDSV